jgi:hypothetical protein
VLFYNIDVWLEPVFIRHLYRQLFSVGRLAWTIVLNTELTLTEKLGEAHIA